MGSQAGPMLLAISALHQDPMQQMIRHLHTACCTALPSPKNRLLDLFTGWAASASPSVASSRSVPAQILSVTRHCSCAEQTPLGRLWDQQQCLKPQRRQRGAFKKAWMLSASTDLVSVHTAQKQSLEATGWAKMLHCKYSEPLCTCKLGIHQL